MNYDLPFFMVFLEETKMDLNSSPSLSNGVTRFAFSNFSSIINSSQKQDSSTSSMTILSLETKLALDCAMQAAL